MRPSSDRLLVFGSMLGLAALALSLCFLTPGKSPWLPPCPFHALTGLYCPGCGSTRMLYFLVHGHPWLAFRQNALAMMMLPGVVYGLARQAINPRSDVFSRIHPRWMMVIGIVVVTFAVARNLPMRPFSLLAPEADPCGQLTRPGCEVPANIAALMPTSR
jgi:hypothetical protein